MVPHRSRPLRRADLRISRAATKSPGPGQDLRSGSELVSALPGEVVGEDAANHVDLGTPLTLDRAEQVVDGGLCGEGRKLALEFAILGTHLSALAQVVTNGGPELTRVDAVGLALSGVLHDSRLPYPNP